MFSAFKTLYHQILRGQDYNTTINGLFTNYLNCNQIMSYNYSIANLADQLAKNSTLLNYANSVQDFRFMKYLTIACIYAYFNFSFSGQERNTELPQLIQNLHFRQADSQKMFDQLRRANLPLNLAYRTRVNYRLDFDDLYGVIQPRVNSNFITLKEKQHLINAMFIMIQNGISLAVKVNTQTAKPLNSIYNKNQWNNNQKDNFQKQQHYSNSKKNNILVNAAGTSSRGFIFAPEFEKYLIYGVSLLLSIKEL